MTQSNKPDDLELSELYQTRKDHSRSPSAIKRHLMAAQSETPLWQDWFRRLGGITLAAATVLLISLVAIRYQQVLVPDVTAPVAVIEIHSMDEMDASMTANISERHEKHYRQFLEGQQRLEKHHQKAAILSQFDDGWELTTCDQEVVRISQQLVDALKLRNMIRQNVKAGDSVNVDFNGNGMILGIQTSPPLPHCS